MSIQHIKQKILEELMEKMIEDYDILIREDDFMDIGKLIGFSIGKYIDDSDEGFDREISFYDGVRHGIDLARKHFCD